MLTMARQLVPVCDTGHPVGEAHPRANLSNADVERIRDLHEHDGYSYDELALMYDTPKSTISSICRYERRIATAIDWRPRKG